MASDQTIRENISRMEDHEILRRLRSNMFSESAEAFALEILISRGIEYSSEAAEINPPEDDSPGMLWPLWFGLTVGTLLGASVGAALGGAIGAGVGALSLTWGMTSVAKLGVARLHNSVSSKPVRIALLVLAWLITAWLAGAVGFALKHAA